MKTRSTTKPILFSLLLILPGTVTLAQSRDTTTIKAGQLANNPNARRNGYENYVNAAQASGEGLNPGATINTIDHRYEGLRGTPYFLPEWNKGQIEMVAGQQYKDVPLKFDAFRQHLILRRPWANNDSIIVDDIQVKSFRFIGQDGQQYQFKHVINAKTNDETLRNGYYLVLYEGKTTLLKRVVKTFRQANYKDPYSNGTRYDEFRNTVSYFILKPDQTLTKVKLSDKSLIESLGDRKNDLKAFVKQENLSFGDETDAIALMKKYDSL